jgi:hypothetical protein
LADGACQSIVRSDWLDLQSETERRIKIKELLLDDAELAKVVDDMKSWSTRMEMFDLIYH